MIPPLHLSFVGGCLVAGRRERERENGNVNAARHRCVYIALVFFYRGKEIEILTGTWAGVVFSLSCAYESIIKNSLKNQNCTKILEQNFLGYILDILCVHIFSDGHKKCYFFQKPACEHRISEYTRVIVFLNFLTF
jgi:hypothetical protein